MRKYNHKKEFFSKKLNESLIDNNSPVEIKGWTSDPSGYFRTLPKKIISSYDKAIRLIKKQYEELWSTGEGNFEEIKIKNVSYDDEPHTDIRFTAGYRTLSYSIYPITKEEYDDYLFSIDNVLN